MISEDFLKAHACNISWYFGRDYGYNGMLAVLFTLKNRAAESDWLDALRYIVLNGPDIALADPREPDFQHLLQTADQVFDDSVQDLITNGALYFTDRNKPFATVHLWDIAGRERVAQVGGLALFK